jgi:hypothetical protein
LFKRKDSNIVATKEIAIMISISKQNNQTFVQTGVVRDEIEENHPKYQINYFHK